MVLFRGISRSVSLSTVTRLTQAACFTAESSILSLQTRLIAVQPNLYCSAHGSSSWPEIMLSD